MTTKLTLTIEKETIERAKIYAKGTQRSLSEMVQSYLNSLGKVEDQDELSPKMKKILSMLKGVDTRTDEELESDKREYLEKKYS
jgi:hypothetical protein